MITAKGKSVSGGIAIGPVRWHQGEERIAAAEWAEDRERELIRLEKARNAAVLRQQGLYERSLKELGKGTAEVFAAHIMMLEDIDLLTAVRREIKEQGHTAEYAVQEAFEAQAKRLSGLDDDYMGERARDVIEMQKELMTALREDSPGYLWNGSGREDPEKPAILLAEDFMPSDVVRLDRSSLLGLVTREGTQNSHTAILARTMGVPMLVQCGEIGESWDGHCAVLDADAGIVYLDPDREMLARYESREKKQEAGRSELQDLKGKASETRDGRRIRMVANISSPEDLNAAREADAEGIGLFRSEYLYLDGDRFPTEEEQFQVYRKAVEAFAPKRVVIRSCDIGTDKRTAYMQLPTEENPALGCRAIRFCLCHPDMFRTQLRALLRASAFGNLGILLPMISSESELSESRTMLKQCREALLREGMPVGSYTLGIMIETPEAVMIADELAGNCDFFSIGTNDLMQYTLAMDRTAPAMNRYFDTYGDPGYTALLRQIRMAVKAGHRHGIPVGICGELGAVPELTEALLRCEIDELSVNPGAILPLRKKIRELDLRN